MRDPVPAHVPPPPSPRSTLFRGALLVTQDPARRIFRGDLRVEGGRVASVGEHDPAQYAAAIWNLLSSPGKLARMSRAARRHASGFGWSSTVDQLLAVYGDAMSEVADAVDA